MTFPSGPGSFTNSMGPWLQSNTAAVPDNSAANLGTDGSTTGRTTTATQTMLSATATARGTQQGVAAISNTASVQIAGVAPGMLAVFKWQ